jgi:hypothetical protein
MLRDEAWLKLGDKHELLCDDCMWRRAHERHFTITLNDLKPCPINVARFWFDLIARQEKAPPENIAEWQAIARDIGVICRRDCEPHPWLIEREEAEALREDHSRWLEKEFEKERGRLEERARFKQPVQLCLDLFPADEAQP